MAAHRKYRWEEWFSTGWHTTVKLVRGKEYHCSQSTMSQAVRSNASARGLRVKIVDKGDHLLVDVIGLRRGWENEVSCTNKTTIAE